ncbi:ABC transporter permease [Ectobacillus polymachus]|uniref:ABC transporter permease n=1 Tax=Ectobacillus polymachus TaxID=1508806 RepID=UPI003A8C3127
MMLLRCIQNDIGKEKRSALPFLLILIPLGTTGAMFLDMFIRYHTYLAGVAKTKGISSWYILLKEYHGVLGWGFFFPIFIAVISAAIYHTEYKQNAWKQNLSLPISRSTALLSKYIVTCLLSFLLVITNILGLLVVGKVVGFPEPIDFTLYGNYVLSQCGAVIGLAAIQNWVSSSSPQFLASPLVSIFGLILASVVPKNVSSFFPYTYTLLGAENVTTAVFGGLLWGLVILLCSIIEFSKRDIVGGDAQ